MNNWEKKQLRYDWRSRLVDGLVLWGYWLGVIILGTSVVVLVAILLQRCRIP